MKKIPVWGLGLFILLLLGGAAWIGIYAATPSSGRGEVTVFIPKGSSVRRIGTILDRQGLVDNDLRFLILARLTGKAGHLQAGEYRLPRGRTPLQILRLLEQGEVIRHQVTIPEGLN
ncbi:MAG TPA: endolytic transglycosylase MltG, partial [Desulfobacteraceae bacterium]|nr:endolytic transglycosylase MltG [Desulfobacteraceae bacterium]